MLGSVVLIVANGGGIRVCLVLTLSPKGFPCLSTLALKACWIVFASPMAGSVLFFSSSFGYPGSEEYLTISIFDVEILFQVRSSSLLLGQYFLGWRSENQQEQ